jgi:hypothetical protein
VSDDRGAVETIEVADIDADGWLDVIIGRCSCTADDPWQYPLFRGPA